MNDPVWPSVVRLAASYFLVGMGVLAGLALVVRTLGH